MAGGVILTKGTVNTPSANELKFQYDTSLNKGVLVDENGNKVVIGGFATADYRVIRVVEYSSGSNVYTPTTGTKAIYVECWGGGGGGAGVAQATASQIVASTGGAGGQYSAAWLTGTLPSTGTTYDAVVAAAANGGSAGNNAGTVGNDSIFRETTGATNKCVAKGGAQGATGNTLATGTNVNATAGITAGSTSSGVGDVTLPGGNSGWGWRASGTQGAGGNGGMGANGGAGGVAPIMVPGTGGNGTAPGGGGSGTFDTGAAARAGGNGAAGRIRITEFA